MVVVVKYGYFVIYSVFSSWVCFTDPNASHSSIDKLFKILLTDYQSFDNQSLFMMSFVVDYINVALASDENGKLAGLLANRGFIDLLTVKSKWLLELAPSINQSLFGELKALLQKFKKIGEQIREACDQFSATLDIDSEKINLHQKILVDTINSHTNHTLIGSMMSIAEFAQQIEQRLEKTFEAQTFKANSNEKVSQQKCKSNELTTLDSLIQDEEELAIAMSIGTIQSWNQVWKEEITPMLIDMISNAEVCFFPSSIDFDFDLIG